LRRSGSAVVGSEWPLNTRGKLGQSVNRLCSVGARLAVLLPFGPRLRSLDHPLLLHVLSRLADLVDAGGPTAWRGDLALCGGHDRPTILVMEFGPSHRAADWPGDLQRRPARTVAPVGKQSLAAILRPHFV